MARKTPSSFIAMTAGGEQLRISVAWTFTEARTRGGTEQIPNGATMHLADGTNVEKISKGVYRTANGVSLTSSDPDAV
ncbi:MAG: hypothetical protein JWN70_5126 [Planctomycetaceae bacterium]|nr:hypothetical protein [Planctomycetaceae bacterium]